MSQIILLGRYRIYSNTDLAVVAYCRSKVRDGGIDQVISPCHGRRAAFTVPRQLWYCSTSAFTMNSYFQDLLEGKIVRLVAIFD